MSARVSHFAHSSVLLVALALSACASSHREVSDAPLSAEEERLFEHGVDFVGRLGGLEGRWKEDYDRDLAHRVAASDLIAIVYVRKSRTDRDPEERVIHRLYGDVERTLHGVAPGPELELLARQGDPGFRSIDDNLLRLQDARLVVYVKWYETETGTAGHFHLSPASDDVVQETEARVSVAVRD
jgi:hypothetical protein